MNRVILLDAGPLGMLAHPRPNRQFVSWYRDQLSDNVELMIPEIADYEVRRELVRAGLTESLKRLDQLKDTLTYLPLTTEIMIGASNIWADARNRGVATASDQSLDGDVIHPRSDGVGNGVFACRRCGCDDEQQTHWSLCEGSAVGRFMVQELGLKNSRRSKADASNGRG